jgi:hypothetical protein
MKIMMPDIGITSVSDRALKGRGINVCMQGEQESIVHEDEFHGRESDRRADRLIVANTDPGHQPAGRGRS